MKFGVLFLLGQFPLLIAGCASSTSRPNQTVLVQSHPLGAKVYDQKDRLLGTTPAYVAVRRGHKVKLLLAEGEQKRTLDLKSHYRWAESFWSNFMFLYFAPVGWGVDFATGDAWRFDNPPVVEFQGTATESKNSQKPKLAIAPPENESMQLSDQGGGVWEQYLTEKFPQVQVLPYEKTLATFNKYQYDYNSKESKNDRPDLLRELGVEYLFESNFHESNLGLEMNGQGKNVFTGSTLDTESLYFDPTEYAKPGIGAWYSRWIHILPNTPSVEYSTHKTRLNVNGGEYAGDHIHGRDPLSRFFNTVGISILHLDPPRVSRGSYWHFELAPAVQLRFSEVQFKGAPTIGSTQFDYFLASLGYGPEVGWKRGSHYLYANAAPLWGYHNLTWHDADGHYSISAGRVTYKAEAGYLLFVGRTSLRIFTRTVTEPDDIWNSAVSRITNGTSSATGAVDTFVGFSVGYTFVPKQDLGWLIH